MDYTLNTKFNYAPFQRVLHQCLSVLIALIRLGLRCVDYDQCLDGSIGFACECFYVSMSTACDTKPTNYYNILHLTVTIQHHMCGCICLQTCMEQLAVLPSIKGAPNSE